MNFPRINNRTVIIICILFLIIISFGIFYFEHILSYIQTLTGMKVIENQNIDISTKEIHEDETDQSQSKKDNENELKQLAIVFAIGAAIGTVIVIIIKICSGGGGN